MDQKRGAVSKISLFFLITITLILVPILFIFLTRIKSEHRINYLLCETDYKVLLKACRELSLRASSGNLKTGTYWVRYNRYPRAIDFKFPKVITDIEPVLVRIDNEGWVMLEMGGIPSYGVVAFPDVSNVSFSFFGDIELIPGLWYYDEDYQGEYPERMKMVEKFIQKGKTRQKERNSETENNKEHAPLSLVSPSIVGWGSPHLQKFCVLFSVG